MRIYNRYWLLVVIFVFTLTIASQVYATDTQLTPVQTMAEEIINWARANDYTENNVIIQDALKVWWCETEELEILANTVYFEAKYCSDRHQQLVAQVVLNRLNDNRFPNTIYEIITAPKQYSKAYVQNLPCYITCSSEMRRCFDNTWEAYIGNVECPDNVIFQSEFPNLGTGTYEIHQFKSPYYQSTTYFNYG